MHPSLLTTCIYVCYLSICVQLRWGKNMGSGKEAISMQFCSLGFLPKSNSCHDKWFVNDCIFLGRHEEGHKVKANICAPKLCSLCTHPENFVTWISSRNFRHLYFCSSIRSSPGATGTDGRLKALHLQGDNVMPTNRFLLSDEGFSLCWPEWPLPASPLWNGWWIVHGQNLISSLPSS